MYARRSIAARSAAAMMTPMRTQRSTTYIALLRAVNVGGTGKLPMAELKALCVEAGFRNVQTYIASGNVVFDSDFKVTEVKTALERHLSVVRGRTPGVFLRTAADMEAVLRENPFAGEAGNLTYAFFLDSKPRPDALAEMRGRQSESIHLGRREIYVHYPLGMGQSKLRLPAAEAGTARNMNTVSKLVDIARRQ
jgi:uncharacterized protein (DUF1697 family)